MNMSEIPDHTLDIITVKYDFRSDGWIFTVNKNEIWVSRELISYSDPKLVRSLIERDTGLKLEEYDISIFYNIPRAQYIAIPKIREV